MSVEEKWRRQTEEAYKDASLLIPLAREADRIGLNEKLDVVIALLSGLPGILVHQMELTLDCHRERMERDA